jgi:glucose/arabinose dehydrogenase
MRHSKRFAAVAVTYLSILVFTSSTQAVDESSPGFKLYQEHCATCHGARLQGGMSQSLIDGVWQFGEGRNYIHSNIKFGLPQLGMPGYDGVLSDAQIGQIVSFLLDSERDEKITRPPIPETSYSLDYTLKIEKWVEGLEVPWSIEFLDKDTALVTERPGRLRVVRNGVLQAEPVRGTPVVLNEGQGGLLDVAIDPAYAANGWIYLSYSHALPASGGRRPGAMTRLVRGRIMNGEWTDEEVVYEAPHELYLTTRHHYGCRIVFDKKGYLYFGIGERGMQDHAQELGRPNGKIHRILSDGTIPEDNPFFKTDNALPTIYAFGNRNPQGLAIHPETDELWEAEHGPLGGDEINVIRAGKNYGWPVITYGRNYNGTIITEFVAKPEMEQPVLYYTPSIAICSMTFYTGNLFDKWKNQLLVTALKYEEVRLLDVKENRVLHDQVILKNAGRVRDIAVGPDGAIYVALNDPGTILRLTPKQN